MQPDHPDAIVISEREDALERAGLLAAGSMAVLYEGLPDASVAEALHALAARRRELQIQ